MHVVIFEVTPFDQGAEAYLEAAAALKETLERIDGFIGVERFQSLKAPQTYLSLSFWESEAAMQRWREHPDHRLAQARGREALFRDYRIRVCQVVREYGMTSDPARPTPEGEKP